MSMKMLEFNFVMEMVMLMKASNKIIEMNRNHFERVNNTKIIVQLGYNIYIYFEYFN